MEQETVNLMRLESISSNGNYALHKKDREIGRLEYSNWLMGMANIHVKDAKIELKPVHIFQNKIRIVRDGKEIGSMEFSADLSTTIKVQDPKDNEKVFLLKNVGVFNPEFELYDEAKEKVMQLTGKNNWKKFKHDYNVEIHGNDLGVDPMELILYTAYGTNIFFERISAL